MSSVSAGRIDITPHRRLPLAGYAGRAGSSQGVHDPLELNAVLVRSRAGLTAILTADLLFVTDDLRQRIAAGVRDALDLEPECLLLAASHTHSAPSVDPGKPRLGAADADYIDFVVHQGATLLRHLATQEARRCTLEYAHGLVDHAINRRRRAWWGSTIRAPNPAGPRDETLHVIRFVGDDGVPAALLWSYACHPVGFPDPTRVSADYPGVVRRELRRGFGPDLPVLFLQGFAGDIRPRPAGRARSLRRRVAGLLVGPLFNPLSDSEYDAWSQSLAARVVAVARSAPSGTHALAPRSRHLRVPLSAILTGGDGGPDLTFRRLSLGPELHIGALSAEPVVEQAGELRRLVPGVALPVGYTDTVFGYLPTPAMLGQAGYEDAGFFEGFGLRGAFRPEVGEVVRTAWRRLFEAGGG